jgi:hypothetical protein
MLYILFCLALNLLPDAATLAALLQIHATIMAFAVFAFIFCPLRLCRRLKSPSVSRHFLIW